MLKTMKGAIALGTFIIIAAAFVLADAVVATPTKAEKTVHAIAIIDGNPAAFTKSGKPRVKALESVLGFDISAADRDAAWKVYQEPSAPVTVNAPVEIRYVDRPDDAAVKELAALKDDYSRLQAQYGDAAMARDSSQRRVRDLSAQLAKAQSDASAMAFRADALAEEVRAARGGIAPCVSERERLSLRIAETWASGWREDASNLVSCLRAR